MNDDRLDPIEALLRAHSLHPEDGAVRSRVWRGLAARGPRAPWRLPARMLVVALAAVIPVAALAVGVAALLQYRPVAGKLVPAGLSTPTPAQTPTPQPSPSAPVLVSVPSPTEGPSLATFKMIDRGNGWALELPAGAVGSNNLPLVRTTDGGQHWAQVQDYVAAMDARTAREAWVIRADPGMQSASNWQGSVRHTTDGGRTWAVVSNIGAGGWPTGIEFVDSLHGWVFATPSAGGATGAGDTTLLRTADGGRSWEKILDAPNARQGIRATLPASCPGGGPISMPVFADAANGWLTGWCQRVFFYATHDGGRTWASQALPAFPGPRWNGDPTGMMYNAWSAQVSAPGTVRVVVSRGFTTGANALQESAMYQSTDRGANWTAVRLPQAATAISFADATHGWIMTAGSGGNTLLLSLYATTDGGQTWRRTLGPADLVANQGLAYLQTNGIQFIDAMTGYLVPNLRANPGQAQMYRSADGGRSWAGFTTTLP